ncbi:MAG: c-type cytochrome [Candidatus Krumholzibacteria bacterium]|nr:c-type cytochrome [Candidatus Krumholzibacteria bacterium]
MIGSANLSAWFPEWASTHAPDVDVPFFDIYVVAAVLLVLTVGLAVVFTRTFLRKEGDPEQMPATGTNKILLGVGVLGAVLLAGFVFQVGLAGFVGQNVAPYGSFEVGVTAREGVWDFTYPDGYVADTLRVAVGQPVHLTMTSQDIAQNISMPDLRVSQAILPGETTEAWFETIRPGTFPIRTAAFSAATYDSMTAVVVSLSAEDFAAWQAAVGDIFAGRTMAEVGELLYNEQGCKVCHSLDGSKLVGPSLKNVYGFEFLTTTGETVLADDAYIKESILTPNVSVIAEYQPVMTPYAGILGDQEIAAITEFLKTISDRGHTGDQEDK